MTSLAPQPRWPRPSNSPSAVEPVQPRVGPVQALPKLTRLFFEPKKNAAKMRYFSVFFAFGLLALAFPLLFLGEETISKVE